MAHNKKHTPPNQGKNYRIDNEYTLTDVAFLLDIKNFGRVSEWENGLSNPSLEHSLTLGLIYQRSTEDIYYALRKKLSKKLEVRKRLLREMKHGTQESDKGG